jgi:hypothetical protein
MSKFEVEIVRKEISTTWVKVEADTALEATSLVQSRFESGELDLDTDDRMWEWQDTEESLGEVHPCQAQSEVAAD